MGALGVAVALGFVVCVWETLLSFAVTPDKWEPAVVQVQVRPLLPRAEEMLEEVGEEAERKEKVCCYTDILQISI